MSQLTKKAIVNTTLRLSKTRALNKITVRDIVEECGITRNTFYYHFHDIYEVLEDMIDEKFEELKGTWGVDADTSTVTLLSFWEEHKAIIYNLYRALGHDVLSDYLRDRLHEVLMERLQAEAHDLSVSQADMVLISAFYEEALLGLLLRTLKEKDTDVLHGEVFGRFRLIFDSALRASLEACAKNTSKF